jgi:hypothetical protein
MRRSQRSSRCRFLASLTMSITTPRYVEAWPVLPGVGRPIKRLNGIHVGFRSKRAPGQRRGSRAGARESPAIPATCSDWGRPY